SRRPATHRIPACPGVSRGRASRVSRSTASASSPGSIASGVSSARAFSTSSSSSSGFFIVATLPDYALSSSTDSIAQVVAGAGPRPVEQAMRPRIDLPPAARLVVPGEGGAVAAEVLGRGHVVLDPAEEASLLRDPDDLLQPVGDARRGTRAVVPVQAGVGHEG